MENGVWCSWQCQPCSCSAAVCGWRRHALRGANPAAGRTFLPRTHALLTIPTTAPAARQLSTVNAAGGAAHTERRRLQDGDAELKARHHRPFSRSAPRSLPCGAIWVRWLPLAFVRLALRHLHLTGTHPCHDPADRECSGTRPPPPMPRCICSERCALAGSLAAHYETDRPGRDSNFPPSGNSACWTKPPWRILDNLLNNAVKYAQRMST